MTRALLTLVLVAARRRVLASTGAGAGDEQLHRRARQRLRPHQGGDLRSSGVPVGGQEHRRPGDKRPRTRDRRGHAAGFGFRKDVFCEVKPQSLIGEYYLDCEPGTSSGSAPADDPRQPHGPDRPARPRARHPAPAGARALRAHPRLARHGPRGRGGDLQATVRRAGPALRETDPRSSPPRQNPAAAHARRRRSWALARNRQDVARFVKGRATRRPRTAARKAELAASVRKLPAFLRELRPDAARPRQRRRPADARAADLRAAAPGSSRRCCAGSARSRTPPRPAVRGLGRRRRHRRSRRCTEARSTVARAARPRHGTAEPMRNLRFVLRRTSTIAKEPSSRTAESRGAGLHGPRGAAAVLLHAVAVDELSTTPRSYILKIGILLNECSQVHEHANCEEYPERAEQLQTNSSRPAGRHRRHRRPRRRHDEPGHGAQPGSAAPPLAATQPAPAHPCAARPHLRLRRPPRSPEDQFSARR